MSLLVVEDVHAGYGSGEVLHGITFTIERGQTVVILGANGAGKTTTLRAVSGMIRARGTIRFRDHDVSGMRSDAVARTGLAHVPEGRGTFGTLNVLDNLRVGGHRRPPGEAAAALEQWFEYFPQLAKRKRQMAASLSGGEQQMLAIARALMSGPELLVVDEPSIGLAPNITQQLFETLHAINKTTGMSMLIVEQNANLALQIADFGVVLEAGALVTSGDAARLGDDDMIRRAYLGLEPDPGRA